MQGRLCNGMQAAGEGGSGRATTLLRRGAGRRFVRCALAMRGMVGGVAARPCVQGWWRVAWQLDMGAGCVCVCECVHARGRAAAAGGGGCRYGS